MYYHEYIIKCTSHSLLLVQSFELGSLLCDARQAKIESQGPRLRHLYTPHTHYNNYYHMTFFKCQGIIPKHLAFTWILQVTWPVRSSNICCFSAHTQLQSNKFHIPRFALRHVLKLWDLYTQQTMINLALKFILSTLTIIIKKNKPTYYKNSI